MRCALCGAFASVPMYACLHKQVLSSLLHGHGRSDESCGRGFKYSIFNLQNIRAKCARPLGHTSRLGPGLVSWLVRVRVTAVSVPRSSKPYRHDHGIRMLNRNSGSPGRAAHAGCHWLAALPPCARAQIGHWPRQAQTDDIIHNMASPDLAPQVVTGTRPSKWHSSKSP